MPKISKEKIKELLTRNVEEAIIQEHLEKDLLRGDRLRVKLGMDPSAPDLHLGHTVVLRKLREFQDLGHTVIFIIGDYTGRIGDPTGRSKTRPQLEPATIEKNAKTYFEQVGKLLDIKKCEIHYNSEWFAKMTFGDVIKLAANFTVARLIERDDFSKRLKSGEELGLHELLYPVMQAYDSVAIQASVEIGGTDQRFNMLAGRDFGRKMGMPEQDVITCPLLIGLDGAVKMSKSLGNYVGITEPPASVYGKLMSISDALIMQYLRLLTDLPSREIDEIEKGLQAGVNPRDVKARLAREIVTMYHGKKDAQEAEKEFEKVFKKREAPVEVKSVKLKAKSLPIIDLLIATKLASSASEARRLVAQKGVKIDGKTVDDAKAVIKIKKEGVLVRKGKRHFIRAMSA